MDKNLRADFREIIQLFHVFIRNIYASVAHRMPKIIVPVRAMYVIVRKKLKIPFCFRIVIS